MIEVGSDGLQDSLSAVAASLGGVHFVPYREIVGTVVNISSNPSQLRLTDLEVRRWQRFSNRLWSWDGSTRQLRDLLVVNATSDDES